MMRILPSAMPRAALALMMLVSVLLALPEQGAAHESRPAYLEINETAPNQFSVLWRTPVLAGNRLLVVLELPEGVTELKPTVTQELSDSRVERRWIDAGPEGLSGKRIDFAGLQLSITDVLVRIKMLDGQEWTMFARPSQPWITIAEKQSWWQVILAYVDQGMRHIAFGIDHLLFVAALMLIVRDWRVLVGTITAFTVAHSITLTSAALGWTTVPSRPVEAMIAVSILLVASEVVRLERGQTSITITWPWAVAFIFGLLHGFGFAGAFVELGLPHNDVLLALLSFNIGVEIGQLCFIAVLLIAAQLAKRIITIPRGAVVAAAYGIGVIAAFWSIERLIAIIP